ncbi:MAG: hypothetical protein J7M19_04350 [Planctomycetes bacterium]|nr:hypothetical protein [Planctomycetota bacterium]
MTPLAQIVPRALSDSVRSYQGGGPGRFAVIMVILLVGILALLVVWRTVYYGRQRRKPLLLFFDLADYHNIPRKTQKRLLRFARAHGVRDPAYLFICPQLVRHIQSLETAEARSPKERRRLEGFFTYFLGVAFGNLAEEDKPEEGGAQ